MNKVYLLLRENRESGPYTIDELIQQQLKPSDLIWEEGKSVAWCYPYELDELKAHVPYKPKLQVVPPPNPSMGPVRQENQQREQIFSAPSVAASYRPDEIESKADQIRNNIISHAQQSRVPYMSTGRTEPSSGAVWTHQEGFEFVHHTRKKYVSLSQLIATGLITILLASAWYGDWSTIRVKPNVITVASAPAAFNETKPEPPVQASTPVLADSQTVAQVQPAYPEGNLPASATSTQRVSALPVASPSDSDMVKEVTQAAQPANTAVSILTSTDTNAAATEAKKEQTPPVEPKEVKKEPVAVKPTPEPANDDSTEVKEEKKKKLGQVIKGIFKKKDKE